MITNTYESLSFLPWLVTLLDVAPLSSDYSEGIGTIEVIYFIINYYC